MGNRLYRIYSNEDPDNGNVAEIARVQQIEGLGKHVIFKQVFTATKPQWIAEYNYKIIWVFTKKSGVTLSTGEIENSVWKYDTKNDRIILVKKNIHKSMMPSSSDDLKILHQSEEEFQKFLAGVRPFSESFKIRMKNQTLTVDDNALLLEEMEKMPNLVGLSEEEKERRMKLFRERQNMDDSFDDPRNYFVRRGIVLVVLLFLIGALSLILTVFEKELSENLKEIETVTPTTSPTLSLFDSTFAPSEPVLTSTPTFKPSLNSTTMNPSISPTESLTTMNPLLPPTETPTTMNPSISPTTDPTTMNPSMSPTETPTTMSPSISPTTDPTTMNPSMSPTETPTTMNPSISPTANPTTMNPSISPTRDHTTMNPSMSPTANPTRRFPITSPTKFPTTTAPTSFPTGVPTRFPTRFPTSFPTEPPTRFPTRFPTDFPTGAPTRFPTRFPTSFPTRFPTIIAQTNLPTRAPTSSQASFPTISPTEYPIAAPTSFPVIGPTLPGDQSRLSCLQIRNHTEVISGSYGENFEIIIINGTRYCGDTFGGIDVEDPTRSPWSVRHGQRYCPEFSYSSGFEVCDSVGARWCSLKELFLGVSLDTGCLGNYLLVYTNTDCENDFGERGKIMFAAGHTTRTFPNMKCVTDLERTSIARCCGDA